MSTRKSVIMGAMAGLLIAAAAVLSAKLNDAWDNERLRTIINFIAAVPAFILSVRMNLPQALQNILFFAYWALLGGITGWLLRQENLFFKLILILFIAALAITHRNIQINLERELEGALRAFGEAIGGIFK